MNAYKVVLGSNIIGQVGKVPKGPIAVQGRFYHIQVVDEKAKELLVSPAEEVVIADEYIPPLRFEVVGYSEHDLPDYIEIEGQYIGEHKVIELKGKLYHAEGGGSRGGVPGIYLSELRPVKAIAVDEPHIYHKERN